MTTNEADIVSASAVIAELKRGGCSGCVVDVFDKLPSTSDYLNQQIREAAQDSRAVLAPRLCIADWQTKGRGRRGKTWLADRGNITFSLLNSLPKPASELLGLSLVTGIVVTETLRAETGITAQLKWPNDVLVDGDKLCGLLTELNSTSTAQSTHIVTGVGINYTQGSEASRQQAADANYRSTSVPHLCNNPPERTKLISSLVVNLIEAYALFGAEGWPVFNKRWDALDYLKGKEVNVINQTSTEQYTAIGVDGSGALLVERAGMRTSVHSGEVSVRLS